MWQKIVNLLQYFYFKVVLGVKLSSETRAIGAIQGGVRTVSPKKTRGEGGVFLIVTWHFSKFFNRIFLFWLAFSTEKIRIWEQIKLKREGAGGLRQCNQMAHGWGGSKIGQKVSRIIWMAPYLAQKWSIWIPFPSLETVELLLSCCLDTKLYLTQKLKIL